MHSQDIVRENCNEGKWPGRADKANSSCCHKPYDTIPSPVPGQSVPAGVSSDSCSARSLLPWAWYSEAEQGLQERGLRGQGWGLPGPGTCQVIFSFLQGRALSTGPVHDVSAARHTAVADIPYLDVVQELEMASLTCSFSHSPSQLHRPFAPNRPVIAGDRVKGTGALRQLTHQVNLGTGVGPGDENVCGFASVFT